ncbi:hypothetical protein COCMIDRAFT_35408 [Bipolaris oryzae ATCC 44560]|uniref:Uncharacterized protein n=1 Tax=Bipolaris oryzae ATCC 44560 TaxID=930090 RepID=W6ZAY3_COCMI|nr:uncharacterized protein COCMIDRAFT_35408 [Bipolaris oryzae ATCC 44560]EUC46968.1 hypothetical protein COCMIDRAFT_35408 [Bipolaris oryzae ATCC 44560]
MSLLTRPPPPSTTNLLHRPNTFTVHFPTEATLHFTLPLPSSALSSLRTPELIHLRTYLTSLLSSHTLTSNPALLSHILSLRRTISLRLSRVQQLSAVEQKAWYSGHGFPIFDSENKATGFKWHWEALEFEYGVHSVAWVVRWLFAFQRKDATIRYALRQSYRFTENEVRCKKMKVEEGHEVVEWSCNGEKVCVWVYGACFRNMEEWEVVKMELEGYEVQMLKEGVAKIRNTVRGGWEFVLYVEGEEAGVEELFPGERTASEGFSSGSQDEDAESFDGYCYGDDVGRMVALASGLGSLALSSRASTACGGDEAVERAPTVPPRVGDLLQQAETLVSAIRGINSQFSSSEEQPSSSAQHSEIPPALQTQPLPPQYAASTIRLPRRTAARRPTKLHRYQAYAEDADTEGSISALPSSWRDI